MTTHEAASDVETALRAASDVETALRAASDVETALRAAPLVAAWQAAVAPGSTSFTIPGHKRRAATLAPALGRLLDADVPLYGGLDTPKLEAAALLRAEELAARAWGADWCRFSTDGSTHANQAIALALGAPGDTVLVARNAHRSTLLGLVLAGLRPVWLPVGVDGRHDVVTGVTHETVRVAIEAHPDAVALLLVEPGYTGAVGVELAANVRLAHEAGLAVVVDQAWGAHFGFHPSYPPHAIALGADALVMSAHKTLLGFSQAAYLLARTDRLDAGRLNRCFDACATTSPSGAVLASLDASRAVLDHPAGARILGELAAHVAAAGSDLRGAGFVVPGPQDYPAGCFDPAKLVIRMGATGCDGVRLEGALAARGIAVEMADRASIAAIVGLGDDASTLGKLVVALVSSIGAAQGGPPSEAQGGPPSEAQGGPPPGPAARFDVDLIEPELPPREAFFAPRRAVAMDDALGRICAEVIAPYPPGIPVLMPGERITAAGLQALRLAGERGTRIAYAADPTLATVLVVDGITPARG